MEGPHVYLLYIVLNHQQKNEEKKHQKKKKKKIEREKDAHYRQSKTFNTSSPDR